MPTPVRFVFNEILSEYLKGNHGRVVDVGGGLFSHRELINEFISYVNIDILPTSGIDISCNFIDALPFQSEFFDLVICTSVLEHLPNPQEVIHELHRILKYGGTLIGYTPFLYPIHSAPLDFWRFSPDGLIKLFESFDVMDIRPVGGRWLLLFHLLYTVRPRMIRKLIRMLLIPFFYPLVQRLDIDDEISEDWTSGYFVLAQKQLRI